MPSKSAKKKVEKTSSTLASLRKQAAELEKNLEQAEEELKTLTEANQKASQPHLKSVLKWEKRVEFLKRDRHRTTYTQRLTTLSKRLTEATEKACHTERAMSAKEREIEAAKVCTSKRKTNQLIRKERELKKKYDQATEKCKKEAEKEVPNPEERPWKMCELCGNQYTVDGQHVPRALNCGHTFCTKCLQELFHTCKIVCPVDGSAHELEVNSIQHEIRKNYLVLDM